MNRTDNVQLSEIASLITKGTTPTTIGYEFQDSGINFLKIECIDEYGTTVDNLVTLFKEMAKDLGINYSFANDDLFSSPLVDKQMIRR